MPSHSQKRPKKAAAGASALKRRRIAIAGGGAVVVLAIVLAVALTAGGSKGGGNNPPPSTQPNLVGNVCPLTDVAAPGGHIPQREPVAVKIGNEPGPSRPQSGLNEADVVYDTPAEGFIMRYIAIYQCQSDTNIGPVRSVRWVDWHILNEFKHVALAFVGGVQPNQNTVASLPWIDDSNEFVHYSAFHPDTARTAPDSTYTSTTAILSLFRHQPAPAPIFRYTSLPSNATAASQVEIDFSAGTDVIWRWDATTGMWLHTYSGTPDIDAATGQQVSTANVVVELVHFTYGPYVESEGGTGDIQSQTLGKGTGYIFRNGKEIKVIWRRKNLTSPTAYSDAKTGQEVGLTPGRTWVELLPTITANLPGHFVVSP